MAMILILAPADGAVDSLSEAVQEAGWTPLVMHDSSGVLDDFASVSPSLVVLDLQIDGGKGVELCRQIRETQGGDLVPILLLGTGQEGIRNFGDALVEGGDYYFEKPLEIPKVISKIRTYVGVDRDAVTQVAPPPGQPGKTYPAKKARKNLAGRVEQMMDLGTAFKDGLLEPPRDDDESAQDEADEQTVGGAEVRIPDQTAVSVAPLERETTIRHRVDPSKVGGMLPPAGKEQLHEEQAETTFPARLDKIDSNFLSPPSEAEAEDDDSSTNSIFAEIKEELDTTIGHDELAEEAQAWSELELEEPEEDESEAEEQAGQEAEEKARQEAEEKARQEAEEKARQEAEEKAKQEAEEKARQEAEEKARQEAEEKARLEAEEKARQEAEEKARLEAEKKARREAEEKARREAEEKARQEAEEEIAEARRVVLTMIHNEDDRRSLLLAKYNARRQEEIRIKNETEAKARREAEEQARREAEEKAKQEAEEKARQEAEEQARREAEEKARREAEEKARREIEEKARRAAEEKARREAEEKARREAEEKARRKAEEKAQREIEEKARREAEEQISKARHLAQVMAHSEDDRRSRLLAEQNARRQEEDRRRREAQEKARAGTQLQERKPAGRSTYTNGQAPFGDTELLQAESLWADALQEARLGQSDRAGNLDQEARPRTIGAGDKLVKLLEREATLAREQAADGDEDELDIEAIPTIPGLPPRPGDKRPDRPTLAEIRSLNTDTNESDDFQREETADLRPPRRFERDDSGDEFEEPKTSPILDMRSLAIRSSRKRDRRSKRFSVREGLLDDSGLPVAEGDGLQEFDEELRQQEEFFSRPVPFAACNPANTDLGQEMVPALFFRLLSQECTGQLIFTNANDQKEVFFERGVPVAVRSTQTADRLEEMLFREGLIDRAAYAEARIKGIGPPRALAAHLVERNLLKPEEYFPLVRRHFEECLLGLFEWTSGQASYQEEMAPDAEKIRLARSVPWLILEGIRRKFLLDRMLRTLGSPSSLLAAVAPDERPRPVADLKSAGFLSIERAILGLVNGLRPIEEIVFLSGQSAITVYRVLLAGVLMGVLTVTVKGIRGGAENKDEVLKTNLEIARRRIDAKFDQANHSSYFEILGVSETSTTYEIEAAYRLLSTEFHPMHFAHPALEDLAEKLATIRAALEEARDVLTDDLLRTGYQQSLMNGST